MTAFTTDQPAFRLHQGHRPLLISMPHVGTYVPPALAQRLTAEARQVPDTDWHLEQLYGFARDLGASILVATHSRYVIDLNRRPDGASLYPGQSVTGLCPVDTFDDPRCTPMARARMKPRSRSAARPCGCLTTPVCRPSCSVCVQSTAWPCCGTRTRSARCCHASSKASCPT